MEIVVPNVHCTGHRTLHTVTALGQPIGNFDALVGSRTLPVVILLKVTVLPFNQTARISTDGVTLFSDASPDPSFPTEEEGALFDASSFVSRRWAYPHLFQMLGSVGIGGENVNMVDDIYRAGIQILNDPSNIGRKVLPLYVLVRRTRVHVVDERVLVGWAMMGSIWVFDEAAEEIEEEERRSGMIPTAKSAMDIMLKNLKVGRKKLQEEGDTDDDESCTICLEEFSEGSIASKMPCSHLFHPNCIRKWLMQSHYCPLCRFEMPTDFLN